MESAQKIMTEPKSVKKISKIKEMASPKPFDKYSEKTVDIIQKAYFNPEIMMK